MQQQIKLKHNLLEQNGVMKSKSECSGAKFSMVQCGIAYYKQLEDYKAQ